MLSSNTNIAERSPRAAAAITYCTASVDFPVPAGPMIKVLLPRSSPPPVSASMPGIPLWIRPTVEPVRCAEICGRGKTTIPPVTMLKS